jgi:toluene monooxygenase system ferredoxin subunit
VLVLRIADGVRAYEDRCAHLGFPLSQGQLEDDVITCSAHHYQYDALTGQGVNPRTACLTTFAVKVEAGKVFVDATQAKRPGDAG